MRNYVVALLLIALIAILVVLAKRQENFNQFRSATLGKYAYNQLKRNNDQDWRKRCKQCVTMPIVTDKDKEFCSHCHEADIRENYSQKKKYILGRIELQDGMQPKIASLWPIQEHLDENFGGLPQFYLGGQHESSIEKFDFYKGSEKIDYDLPKSSGCCWPGKQVYGLGL